MPLVEIYMELALQDPGSLEFAPCVGIRRKPPMGRGHASANSALAIEIGVQLRGLPFQVVTKAPALQLVDGEHYFMPDACVVPHELRGLRNIRPAGLWTIAEALPLVVEVWSPSTGHYDTGAKFAEYRARGDEEIWRIHPYEMTGRHGEGSKTAHTRRRSTRAAISPCSRFRACSSRLTFCSSELPGSVRTLGGSNP